MYLNIYNYIKHLMIVWLIFNFHKINIEDRVSKWFSAVFVYYLKENCHYDKQERLNNVCDVIQTDR